MTRSISVRIGSVLHTVQLSAPFIAGHLRHDLAISDKVQRGIEFISLYNEWGLPMSDAHSVEMGHRYVLLVHLHPILRFVVIGTEEVRELYVNDLPTARDAYEVWQSDQDQTGNLEESFVLFHNGEPLESSDERVPWELSVQWKLDMDPGEWE